MKIMVITGAEGGGFKMTPGVDSAILRPGEPVFLPESGLAGNSTLIPAVHICRLGYCVKSNAASYFDSLTLFHALTPAPQDIPAWLPPYCADRTFSPGKWIPFPDTEITEGTFRIAPLPGRKGEERAGKFAITLPRAEIEKYIREISRCCTIKTGDLLLFPEAGVPLGEAVADTSVDVDLQGENILKFRIK